MKRNFLQELSFIYVLSFRIRWLNRLSSTPKRNLLQELSVINTNPIQAKTIAFVHMCNSDQSA